MDPLASIAKEIEDAVGSGDPARRTEALRRMTNLFVEQAPHLKAMHVTVFDEVILRLARDIEFRARMELSDRLADVPNAPPRVVRDLAFDDDIAVAGPVLERSPRLAEGDLVEIAAAKGQDHLLSLTRRATLPEAVTDVIVDRGDTRVVRSVAGNQGARFSPRGFQELLEKARADETLQGILRARRDIPPRQLARLVEIAREQVRETLRPEFKGSESELLDEAIDEVSGAVARAGGSPTLVDDFRPAIQAVEQRARRAPISEDDVLAWLKEGRVAEALVAIAHIANINIEMVAGAYHSPHYDPMLFIVRSLRFGWITFKMLLTCKAGREPSEGVLKNAFDAYQHLSVQTATRVVRFTAVRGGTLPAAS
ncbi:DUF2336 domain-containing protein [Salinarimonas soli]|uniref:DUF2336 domain-containing protein n=1 Tax=Salinarimonas soli TaxID=1638099 RepID=A0A5B2VDJ8_9HYPH|nr:DUF2336 domain-containing protein [Salinarimonas soli]KAA2236808.1 DUF2336 domain-containing protein [Salinarimonas soli]